eukprot:CCRYP_002603-RA/>CCRYP_002603-RA protein AED:0.00 eAED:0.00 QI:6/1/1/1/0/0/2/361/91
MRVPDALGIPLNAGRFVLALFQCTLSLLAALLFLCGFDEQVFGFDSLINIIVDISLSMSLCDLGQQMNTELRPSFLRTKGVQSIESQSCRG